MSGREIWWESRLLATICSSQCESLSLVHNAIVKDGITGVALCSAAVLYSVCWSCCFTIPTYILFVTIVTYLKCNFVAKILYLHTSHSRPSTPCSLFALHHFPMLPVYKHYSVCCLLSMHNLCCAKLLHVTICPYDGSWRPP